MVYDPDFGKRGFAARLFRLRFRTLRMQQPDFPDRFGLSLGAVKDLEQGRTKPTRAVQLLVAAIEMAPDLMAKVAEQERPALSARPASGHRWQAGPCLRVTTGTQQ